MLTFLTALEKFRNNFSHRKHGNPTQANTTGELVDSSNYANYREQENEIYIFIRTHMHTHTKATVWFISVPPVSNMCSAFSTHWKIPIFYSAFSIIGKVHAKFNYVSLPAIKVLQILPLQKYPMCIFTIYYPDLQFTVINFSGNS